MDDKRQEGKLAFVFEDGTAEEVPIYWEKRAGNISDGSTWRASVSFTRDWKLPDHAKSLVTRYLSSETATMKLRISDDIVAQCGAIFEELDDMEDFWTWGAMPIGSPDLGRAYLKQTS